MSSNVIFLAERAAMLRTHVSRLDMDRYSAHFESLEAVLLKLEMALAELEGDAEVTEGELQIVTQATDKLSKAVIAFSDTVESALALAAL